MQQELVESFMIVMIIPTYYESRVQKVVSSVYLSFIDAFDF